MAQVAEEAKVEIPEDLQDVVGQRIRVESSIGTIRYIGPVATSKKATTIWLGIEWDDENRGKNDGAVTTPDGTVHRYFTTTDGRGSFIKPVKATFGRDILAAINARFSLETLEDDVKEQQQIAQESNFKIEFVGWDKSIRRQCDLTKKTSVALEDHDVRYIDLSHPTNSILKLLSCAICCCSFTSSSRVSSENRALIAAKISRPNVALTGLINDPLPSVVVK